LAGTPASWHNKYAQSAWIYVGNLDVALSEGDVICVCSQFGEISDVHLVREEGTGKSKGFAFVKYENAKSCILAVDNLCGSNVCGRSLRIDHVENYRLPKEVLEKQEQEEGGGQVDVTKAGQAYQGKELENDYSLEQGQDLFAPVASSSSNTNANPPTTEDKDRSEEARRKRKEERRLLRLQKEQRRQERERKRTEREEKERKKRSKKVKRDDSIDNESDSRRETKQDRKKHSSRKRHSRDEEDSKERKSKKREKRSRSRSRSVS